MARVLKKFEEPDDPRHPKGAVRRALWRTIKLSLSGTTVRAKPFVVIGLFWLLYEWGNPHLLTNYSYVGQGASRIYTRCEYFGLSPFEVRGGDCPVIVWREWPKI